MKGERNVAKIHGRVTDFDGNPLPGTEALVKDYSFDDLYKGVTDEDGFYEIEAEKGVYYRLPSLRTTRSGSLSTGHGMSRYARTPR